MTHLLERFRRDILGIAWTALALFLALSLYSYHATDPSLNTISSGILRHASSIKNLCGYFGSFTSDVLYQLFGIACWIFVFGAAKISYRFFNGGKTENFKSRVSWAIVLVLVVSCGLGLYFPETKIYEKQIALSGLLGTMASHGLISVFNRVGVAIILWASAAALLVFYTEKRIAELAPGFFTWIRRATKAFVPTKGFGARALGPALPPPLRIAVPVENVNEWGEEKIFSFKKPAKAAELPTLVKANPRDVLRQIENWQLPQLDLLLDPPSSQRKIDEREITRNARLVEQKLAEFDVLGNVVEVKPGPAVTMYEFKPAASIKINDITKLSDDLSLALSAESLRIIAPIPGRDVVGIETSNSTRDSIYMKELVEAPDFWSEDIKLPVALGKSVCGDAKIIDLRKIPHLLVAGTTGSGKSVFTMSLVTSLIMRHSPKTLRLILVDPKQVDLAAFHRIPHLLLPPVKEAKSAVATLKWLIKEMEKRYRSMSRFNSKNIESFNTAVAALKPAEITEHEEKVRILEENPQTVSQGYYFKPVPYIVTVIEEFADLMSVDRNGVEPAVVRLAQMARASGIHLVLAMQSPRREVLTGLIKTNFPGRICFKVASKVDSSIVLDQRGAERLLSVGDMLYLAPGLSTPLRYHGAFLRDEEMAAVTDFWIKQGEPQFEASALNSVQGDHKEDFSDGDPLSPGHDEDYDHVVAFVASQKEVSASLLQRRFRFGYPKASRLIEMLENEGVIGPANGSKPRQVLTHV